MVLLVSRIPSSLNSAHMIHAFKSCFVTNADSDADSGAKPERVLSFQPIQNERWDDRDEASRSNWTVLGAAVREAPGSPKGTFR